MNPKYLYWIGTGLVGIGVALVAESAAMTARNQVIWADADKLVTEARNDGP